MCEGETEEISIRHFVRRQWEADGLSAVGLHPINLGGKLEDIFAYVPRYRLDSRVVAVFTVIDLYGMNRVRHGQHDELADKVARVKHWLRDGVDASLSSYFHPHVSVHEVEAWVLAEGECLARRLKDSSISPESNAEGLDFINPPSRRIDALCRSHRHGDGFHKINDGTPLFKCLQFGPVYGNCRYFREFYDDIKSVGQLSAKPS